MFDGWKSNILNNKKNKGVRIVRKEENEKKRKGEK
jgi:hypothetical protein